MTQKRPSVEKLKAVEGQLRIPSKRLLLFPPTPSRDTVHLSIHRSLLLVILVALN